jgi:hypothetical protein
MRKQWSCGAAVMVFVLLVVCGAAAQGPGPQGVGADKAAQKEDSSHSYNPIKWMKKDSKTKAEKPKRIKNKKGKPAATDTLAQSK